MSIVAAFNPQGPLVLVGTTPVQAPTSGSIGGASQYRFRNLSSSAQYFTWGNTNSVTSVGPPAAGVPSANTIGMLPNSVETFTLPPNAWFVAQTSTGFEVLPGEGV